MEALLNDLTQQKAKRFNAIDIVRGHAMLAMLISHSAWWIDHFEYRAAFGWDNLIVPAIDTPQSWIGFILQIASPTFFLLGGMSLAFFVASRSRPEKGWSQWRITRFLLTRGSILVLLDLTLMNLKFTPLNFDFGMSVLTGMGLCVMALAFLRHLSWKQQALLALVLTMLVQAWYYWHGRSDGDFIIRSVFLAPGAQDRFFVLYPMLPWLPVMMLGYITGSQILTGNIRDLGAFSLRLGLLLLVLWLMVVEIGEFGNLYPQSPFIYGKHPPDLAYLSLYLGIAYLLIALHVRLEHSAFNWLWNWLKIFGQASLFFYLAHVRVVEALTLLLAGLHLSPMMLSLTITLVALPLLLLLSRLYRRIKEQYPESLLQYI